LDILAGDGLTILLTGFLSQAEKAANREKIIEIRKSLFIIYGFNVRLGPSPINGTSTTCPAVLPSFV
jgi:hypothetical protein